MDAKGETTEEGESELMMDYMYSLPSSCKDCRRSPEDRRMLSKMTRRSKVSTSTETDCRHRDKNSLREQNKGQVFTPAPWLYFEWQDYHPKKNSHLFLAQHVHKCYFLSTICHIFERYQLPRQLSYASIRVIKFIIVSNFGARVLPIIPISRQCRTRSTDKPPVNVSLMAAQKKGRFLIFTSFN